uniref:hypothetical protein n=1 Tax=Deinococcus sp. TaxID=47478 RepID=UPI002869D323
MKRLICTLSLLTPTFVVAAPLPSAPLTLGPAGTGEQRRSVALLPGVNLTTIERGRASAEAGWT